MLHFSALKKNNCMIHQHNNYYTTTYCHKTTTFQDIFRSELVDNGWVPIH